VPSRFAPFNSQACQGPVRLGAKSLLDLACMLIHRSTQVFCYGIVLL